MAKFHFWISEKYRLLRNISLSVLHNNHASTIPMESVRKEVKWKNKNSTLIARQVSHHEICQKLIMMLTKSQSSSLNKLSICAIESFLTWLLAFHHTQKHHHILLYHINSEWVFHISSVLIEIRAMRYELYLTVLFSFWVSWKSVKNRCEKKINCSSIFQKQSASWIVWK